MHFEPAANDVGGQASYDARTTAGRRWKGTLISAQASALMVIAVLALMIIPATQIREYSVCRFCGRVFGPVIYFIM
jgi:hypothetical protein